MMFSVVVLFPWTRREKVSLVMFSVVVLLFGEKGCLVRGRRRGSSWSKDQEERCLVGSSSGREEMELRVDKTPGGNLLCS